MKKLVLILTLIIMRFSVFACDVCERQQPKILRGITHGAGPDSEWDYLIIGITILIVLFTLFFTVKWLINPGEQSKTHIKRFIFNTEDYGR